MAEEKEPVAKAAGAGSGEGAKETQSLRQNAPGPSQGAGLFLPNRALCW